MCLGKSICRGARSVSLIGWNGSGWKGKCIFEELRARTFATSFPARVADLVVGARLDGLLSFAFHGADRRPASNARLAPSNFNLSRGGSIFRISPPQCDRYSIIPRSLTWCLHCASFLFNYEGSDWFLDDKLRGETEQRARARISNHKVKRAQKAI